VSGVERFRHGDNLTTHFGTQKAARDRAKVRNSKIVYPVLLNIDHLYDIEDESAWGGSILLTCLVEKKIISNNDADEIKKGAQKVLKDLMGFTDLEQSYILQKEYSRLIEEYLKKINIKNVGFQYVNKVEDKGSTSYAVLDPEQIYILGSNIDVKNFKDFIKKHKK